MEEDLITDEMEQEFMDRFIRYMNDMLEVDRPGVQRLMSFRAQTNEALAHGTLVQCDYQQGTKPEENRLEFGTLGFINGFFGVDEKDRGHIAGFYEGGRLVRFGRTTYTD